MLTLEVRRRPGTGAEMHRITGGKRDRRRLLGQRSRRPRARRLRAPRAAVRARRRATTSISSRASRPSRSTAASSSAARSPRETASRSARRRSRSSRRPRRRARRPVGELPEGDARIAASRARPAAPGCPVTEVEYRGLRLSAYRLCRQARVARGSRDRADGLPGPGAASLGVGGGRVLRPSPDSGRWPRPSARTRCFLRGWSRTSGRASASRARRPSPEC